MLGVLAVGCTSGYAWLRASASWLFVSFIRTHSCRYNDSVTHTERDESVPVLQML